MPGTCQELNSKCRDPPLLGESVAMRGSPKSGKRRPRSGPRPSWWKLEDALWEQLEPLLRDPPRRLRNTGRKRYPARACLEGVLYLLYTGVRYVDLPRELGLPSGETCRRRLHEWIGRGVWPRALALLVEELTTKVGSTGRAWSSMPRSWRPKRGRPDRAEPGQPRASREQVPPRCRCPGLAA